MDGVDLRTPERVRVRPQHTFRPRCRAGRVLHADRSRGVGRQARRKIGITEQPGEAVVRGRRVSGRHRRAVVVTGHRDPFQVARACIDHLGKARLRDRRDRAAMPSEIGELFGGRACIGGDRDGSGICAGKPSDEHFRAILEMDQDEITGFDAARAEARGAFADAMLEFGVGQPLALTFERLPNQESMTGARFGA